MDTIQQTIADSIAVKQAILADARFLQLIDTVAREIVAVYSRGGKLLLAGNGGSASDAQHIAGEMVNRFCFDRPPLSAIALSTDTSVLTAIGNDSAFDQVFARQVDALGVIGDLFIGLSTSGGSPNIINAFQMCKKKGIVRVGLTGEKGRSMAEWCDYCFVVPSVNTPRVQEAHVLIYHILCQQVEASIFGGRG